MFKFLLIFILIASTQAWAQTDSGDSSLAEDLAELAALFERGLLTNEEFSAAKAELLNMPSVPKEMPESSNSDSSESSAISAQDEVLTVTDLAVREGTYSGDVKNIGTAQNPQYVPHGNGTLNYTAEGIVAPYKNGRFVGVFRDGKPTRGIAFSGMSGRIISGSGLPGESIWGATAQTTRRLQQQNNSNSTRRAVSQRNYRPRQTYQQRPSPSNSSINSSADILYRAAEQYNPSLSPLIPQGSNQSRMVNCKRMDAVGNTQIYTFENRCPLMYRRVN